MLKFLAELGKGGKQITDKDIVDWCTETVSKSGKKGKINNFSDGSTSGGVYFVNLLAGAVPDIDDWNLVQGNTDDDKLLNAKYAISLARKIGAVMFVLPEDIVEVRPKMCLTVMHKLCKKK